MPSADAPGQQQEFDHDLASRLQALELTAERARLEQWGLKQRGSWAWLSRALEHAGTIGRVMPRVNTRTTLDAAEVDASRKLLEQRIALYGMEEREVDGDGNCQFRALAHQLLGTQHAHATIRAVVINQLKYVSERYQPHVPDSYDNYLEAMARDGTWGDHVTLQAAADAYNARIVILTSYDATAFVEIQPSTPVERVAFLSFWAELHYNALCVAEDSCLSDWTVTDEDVELQPWQRPWNVRRRWRVPTRDPEQLGNAGVLDRLFVAAPDWLRYGIG